MLDKIIERKKALITIKEGECSLIPFFLKSVIKQDIHDKSI